MTREQQQATREMDAAHEKFLRTYGWVQEHGRWVHPQAKVPCRTFDAIVLTRAQPLLFDRRS